MRAPAVKFKKSGAAGAPNTAKFDSWLGQPRL